MSPPEWDGVERRAEDGSRTPSLSSIEAILHRLDAKIEAHLQEEEAMKPYIKELIDVLQKSKGAIAFLKILVYIGGILAAFMVWAKDHIKW